MSHAPPDSKEPIEGQSLAECQSPTSVSFQCDMHCAVGGVYRASAKLIYGIPATVPPGPYTRAKNYWLGSMSADSVESLERLVRRMQDFRPVFAVSTNPDLTSGMEKLGFAVVAYMHARAPGGYLRVLALRG